MRIKMRLKRLKLGKQFLRGDWAKIKWVVLDPESTPCTRENTNKIPAVPLEGSFAGKIRWLSPDEEIQGLSTSDDTFSIVKPSEHY